MKFFKKFDILKKNGDIFPLSLVYYMKGLSDKDVFHIRYSGADIITSPVFGR